MIIKKQLPVRGKKKKLECTIVEYFRICALCVIRVSQHYIGCLLQLLVLLNHVLERHYGIITSQYAWRGGLLKEQEIRLWPRPQSSRYVQRIEGGADNNYQFCFKVSKKVTPKAISGTVCFFYIVVLFQGATCVGNQNAEQFCKDFNPSASPDISSDVGKYHLYQAIRVGLENNSENLYNIQKAGLKQKSDSKIACLSVGLNYGK